MAKTFDSKTDDSSPDLATVSGVAAGAAVGSLLGPMGAAVGAMVGGVAGRQARTPAKSGAKTPPSRGRSKSALAKVKKTPMAAKRSNKKNVTKATRAKPASKRKK
jgi:hypothetical protein